MKRAISSSFILCILCALLAAQLLSSCDSPEKEAVHPSVETPLYIGDIYAAVSVDASVNIHELSLYGSDSVMCIVTAERGRLCNYSGLLTYDYSAIRSGGSVFWTQDSEGEDTDGPSYIRAVFYDTGEDGSYESTAEYILTETGMPSFFYPVLRPAAYPDIASVIGFAIVRVDYDTVSDDTSESEPSDNVQYADTSDISQFTVPVTFTVVYQCMIDGADEEHPVTDEYIKARTEEIIGREWRGKTVGYDDFINEFGGEAPEGYYS